jgi:hypothetical protein
MNKIDQYLHDALKRKASDLHFVSGDPVRVRVHGLLDKVDDARLDIETARECLLEIMSTETQRAFERDEAERFSAPQWHRGDIPLDPLPCNVTGGTQSSAGHPFTVQTDTRHDPGHRQDRIGKVDNPRGDDR